MISKIPPKIHFLFLNKKEQFPSVFKTCYERIKEFHPDWEIKIYNEDDAQKILLEHFPSMIPVYNSYAHVVQKSDILRVILVYLFGGFYMDLDMFCLKSLDELCDHELVLGKEFLITEDELFRIKGKHKLQVANYMFGAKPHHPFWLDFLKESIKMAGSKIRKEQDIINCTGPQLLTNVYYTNRQKYKRITLLNNIDRECLTGHQEISCHFGNFAGHLHQGTWRWRGKKKTLPLPKPLSKMEYKSAIIAINILLKEFSILPQAEIILLKTHGKELDCNPNLKQLYEKLKSVCKIVSTTKNRKGTTVLILGDPFGYVNKISNLNTNILFIIPGKVEIEDNCISCINEYYDYCIVPHEYIKDLYLNAGVQIPVQTIPLGFQRARRNFFENNEEEMTDFTIAFSCGDNKNALQMLIAACENIREYHIPNLKLKLVIHPAEAKNSLYLKEVLKSKLWISSIKLSGILLKGVKSVHCYIFLDPLHQWVYGTREILYEGTPCIITDHPIYRDFADLDACYMIKANEYLVNNIEQSILDVFNNYSYYNKNALNAGRWIEDKWTLEFTSLEIFWFVKDTMKKSRGTVKSKIKMPQL